MLQYRLSDEQIRDLAQFLLEEYHTATPPANDAVPSGLCWRRLPARSPAAGNVNASRSGVVAGASVIMCLTLKVEGQESVYCRRRSLEEDREACFVSR